MSINKGYCKQNSSTGKLCEVCGCVSRCVCVGVGVGVCAHAYNTSLGKQEKV